MLWVAATLNLYAYHNGKHPGFSAGVVAAVFKRDGDRFGGVVAVDAGLHLHGLSPSSGEGSRLWLAALSYLRGSERADGEIQR